MSKQYSTDTSHSSSIYLEPKKFSISLIRNFICQKCSPHPPEYSSGGLTVPLLQQQEHQIRPESSSERAEWQRVRLRGPAVEFRADRAEPLSGEQKSGPQTAHRFSFPVLWRNPVGSAYRSSNVKDEAHPLRDSCCVVETVWEDHQQNSASGNTTKTLSAVTQSQPVSFPLLKNHMYAKIVKHSYWPNHNPLNVTFL